MDGWIVKVILTYTACLTDIKELIYHSSLADYY